MKPDTATPSRSRWLTGLEIAGFILVGLAMACAMYFSGWSMWHVIADKFGLVGRPELIVPMFALFDLAGTACAVLATWSLLTRGKRGAAYPLVWLFSLLSGLMSASDGTNLTAQAMRFAAPAVAAGLFELLLSIKRQHVTGEESWILRLLQPLRARLGLLDPKQTDSDAARAAAVGKLATRAYAMHQHRAGTWRRKRAERRYLRKIRAAVERFGIATDEEMIQSVRAGVAVLHGAVDQTKPENVADASPWVRKFRAEYPRPVRAELPSVGAQQRREVRAEVPAVSAEVQPANVVRRITASPAGTMPSVVSIAAHGPGNGKPARRPAAETQRLYADLVATQPGLTQKQYAAALGITDKALRDALAKTTDVTP